MSANEIQSGSAADRTAYRQSGAARARTLGNRGPLRFAADGSLAPEILDAYWAQGFYVFEGVIGEAELEELRTDADALIARAPVGPGANRDRAGNLPIDHGLAQPCFRFAPALSDPFGGTAMIRGRFQVKMGFAQASEEAPDVVLHVTGIMQLMDSALRLYGHPELLRVAATINGPDFTPFTAGMWVKQPGIGPAVAWHQDGTTHWENADLDAGTHGFNFMTNLYPTDPANALWIVPGTHRIGKLDLGELADPDSGLIDDAVPLLAKAGDVAICNRQVVHGSFPNDGDKPRLTINFGFHRRRSVLGVQGWAEQPYDLDHILQRSRVVQVAINARRERFPDEPVFLYEPLTDEADALPLSERTRAEVLKDYNLLDIGI